MESVVQHALYDPAYLTDCLLLDTKNPSLISPAYTSTSIWRNRDEFFSGTAAIENFLTRKWEKERNYRLRKELFAFDGNKMYVCAEGIQEGRWLYTVVNG